MATPGCKAQCASGWTLPGLLIALAVLAAATTLATPSFRDLAWRSRRTTAINEFVRGLHLARSESIKRARQVTLCPLDPRGQCLGRTGSWADGWMVFVDLPGGTALRRDPGEPVLLKVPASPAVRSASNRASYVLRPFGQRATNGSVSFCDPTGTFPGATVVVSYTGRPRISHNTPSSGALACP